MKNKNKILSIVTLSIFGAMLCACNFESKTSDNSLFVRKTSGFNSIFYVGEPISYDGIKVVDSNNEEVSDYTFSIEEGTILGYESDKLTIEVSKPGYEKASFNVTVLREGYPYEGTIDIYSINDFHGAFSYSQDDEQTGFSRIATYLLNKKEENPFTVIVSAGDMWQGGIESNKTKGKIVNEAMNIATFDAMTLGNHEFDWGEEVIKENASLAEFPYLGSNLTYSSNDERPSYLKGSTIVNRGEVKIGIIGSLASDLGSDITASISKNFNFNDPNDYVIEESNKLKEEGCDLIFLVAHDSGFYDYGTDRDFKFYHITSGDYVDGIFLGHDHFVKSGSINEVPYLEGGKNGNYISHMSFSFTLDKDKNFSLGNSRSYETIITQGIEFNTPNTLVDNLTTKYKEVIGDVNRVICSFNEYKSKDDLLNIACKAIISYINNHKDLYGIEVTVGVHNTGGVRDSAQRGDFTYSDLIRVFPFSNTLVLFNVTPEEYYDVIDSNYSVIKEAPTFTNGVATIGTINYVAEYYGTNFTDTGILIQDVIEEYLSENY